VEEVLEVRRQQSLPPSVRERRMSPYKIHVTMYNFGSPRWVMMMMIMMMMMMMMMMVIVHQNRQSRPDRHRRSPFA
jgi:hypothetical protein